MGALMCQLCPGDCRMEDRLPFSSRSGVVLGEGEQSRGSLLSSGSPGQAACAPESPQVNGQEI